MQNVYKTMLESLLKNIEEKGEYISGCEDPHKYCNCILCHYAEGYNNCLNDIKIIADNYKIVIEEGNKNGKTK